MTEKILSNFRLFGDFIDSKPFGNGYINDTFLVTFNQSGTEVKYILRKINKYVFENPKIVVNNTVNVIAHISEKLKSAGVREISNHVMKLVESNDSNFYYIDENGDYWCVIFFISNAYTLEKVTTKEEAYESAKAFGQFQKHLIDVDVTEYKDSIPNFHNLSGRIADFDLALENNSAERVEQARKEIEVVNKYKYLSERINKMLANGELPIRITHNDTKINNVMLNKETHKGQCVIDLDTVMSGTVLYDFGDMVRTSTSPADEDEEDASKVTMRLEIFEGLVKGYLGELAKVLTEIEIKNLVYGAMVIVYEQLVRFLTDFISGDVYYATKYDTHNLVRTRTQIELLKSILKQSDEMEKVVHKYAEGLSPDRSSK